MGDILELVRMAIDIVQHEENLTEEEQNLQDSMYVIQTTLQKCKEKNTTIDKALQDRIINTLTDAQDLLKEAKEERNKKGVLNRIKKQLSLIIPNNLLERLKQMSDKIRQHQQNLMNLIVVTHPIDTGKATAGIQIITSAPQGQAADNFTFTTQIDTGSAIPNFSTIVDDGNAERDPSASELRFVFALAEDQAFVEGVKQKGLCLDFTKFIALKNEDEFVEVVKLQREPFMKLFDTFKDAVSKIHSNHAVLKVKRVRVRDANDTSSTANVMSLLAPPGAHAVPGSQNPDIFKTVCSQQDEDTVQKANGNASGNGAATNEVLYDFQVYLQNLGVNGVYVYRHDESKSPGDSVEKKPLTIERGQSIIDYKTTQCISPGRYTHIKEINSEVRLQSGDLLCLVMKNSQPHRTPQIAYRVTWDQDK